MGTLMNILLFCNVSKFHAASEQQQELNEQNGLHTQINYSNETQSLCPVSLPPENVPPSSCCIKTNYYRQIRLSMTMICRKNHFFHPVFQIERKQFQTILIDLNKNNIDITFYFFQNSPPQRWSTQCFSQLLLIDFVSLQNIIDVILDEDPLQFVRTQNTHHLPSSYLFQPFEPKRSTVIIKRRRRPPPSGL